VIAICFVIATDTFARKGKPCSTVSVTSTIRDSDANFTPYRIQSDLLGSFKNCVDSVQSIIQGIGAWELDMLGSPVRFLSNCQTSLLNLSFGATTTCSLIIAVDHGADRYSIRFNSINYPGTN